MDRETYLAIQDLIKVTKGIQNTVEGILNVNKLLIEKVEKLETEIDRLKEE